MSSAYARLTGLLATLTLIGVVAGLPILLLHLGANPLPTHVPSLPELTTALTRPDDGTLALGAVAVMAWIAWLFLTSTFLLELIARLRGITTPRLPGLRLPQAAAATLINSAVMLFIAAPILLNPAPRAQATPVAPVASSIAAGTSRPAATSNQQSRQTTTTTAVPPASAPPTAETTRYTVKRGDSLWSIAEQHLGSGTRYVELARLNSDTLHHRPGFLTPGMLLQLPTPTGKTTDHAASARHVIVQRGDTLSEIAEEELGDPNRYPEIFHASKPTTQPGGEHLSDPDLIDVGWTLTIPDTKSDERHEDPTTRTGKSAKPPIPQTDSSPTTPSSTTPSPRTPRATASKPPTAPTSPPRTTPSPTSTQAPHSPSTDTTATPVDDQQLGHPSWLLTGLTGGGAVLAGSALMMVRRRRRTQNRHRRPGRTIASPAPTLAPVERTMTVVGSTSAPAVDRLDSLLRRLAASSASSKQDMPALAAVEMAASAATLHLAAPFELPSPWKGTDDGLSWTIDHGVDLDNIGPATADQPAPYPLLVTVGSTEDGHVWLLDLERLGVLHVTGDPTETQDLARYIAAELACNPWSQGVTVGCCGVAYEVAAMNPERIRIDEELAALSQNLDADAAATIQRTTEAAGDVVTARARQTGPEAWPANVLLLGATRRSPAPLTQLLQRVLGNPGRTGAAVVVVGPQQSEPGPGTVAKVNGGLIRIPHLLDKELAAVGLTSDEALGCAALLAQAEETESADIPNTADGDGWRSHANEAGALSTEQTLPRNLPPHELPEPVASMLDGDDEDYLQSAATTADDLAVLAPQVPLRIRTEVEDADPTLDADLDAWFNPDSDLPRLTLLGPVGARTRGTAIAKRKPYYTELLAYLVTRPHGATPEEVAGAFSLTAARVRNDIKVLRDWLGINPRTGRKHLPDARESEAARDRGIGVYQVEDVLSDADLFRRLRVRGESRGTDGILDLRTALKLVSGQPFDKLRPGGWGWLYEGNRLDQTMICAIVDVAHIITTHSLRQHDLPLARAAAEIALLAAPYEEIPRLDLAAVAAAEGRRGEATRIVREDISNRSDDGQAPIELPDRTEDILQKHNWLMQDKAS